MESNPTGSKRSGSERGTTSKPKSCAECKRMKIKCDREVKVPCSYCLKRGCGHICPDGRRKKIGDSTILAGTEELHTKIEELTQRIHELEDALETLQAQLSHEPHPILKKSDEASLMPTGSLVIKEDGGAYFFGASSSIEWVMNMEEESNAGSSPSETMEDNTFDRTGNERTTESIAAGFPLLVERIDKITMMERAIAELPRRELASVLVDCYYYRATWLISLIRRRCFLEDYFEPCYNRSMKNNISLQEFALVYATLALGMASYMEEPRFREISAKYNAMSLACLAAGDFATSRNLCVIDALLLCSAYYHSGDDPADPHKGWILLGVAFRLAITMGLHREPSTWGLPAEECARRRRTMWELVSYDLWGSLVTGRPPMISRQHFNVMVPMDSSEPADSNPNFIRGKHHFNQTCFWHVIDFILVPSNQTTYSAALKLDAKVRGWRLPSAMVIASLPLSDEENTIKNFQEGLSLIFKEIVLLCLHRAYFACAILEPPFDPLGSAFSRSVLAAYGSACAIVAGVRTLHSREPILTLRCGLFWTYSFSAAVILSSIAICAPDCRLARTALVEFDRTVKMFKRAQAGLRARRVMPVLLRLQSKAHTSFNSYLAGTWTKPTSTDTQLRQGLSASSFVNHAQARVPISNETVEPVLESDLMASLEAVESAFIDYSGFTGFDVESQYNNADDGRVGSGSGGFGGSGSFPAGSDDFLHGILTGQWADLSYHPVSSFQIGSSSNSGYQQVDPVPFTAPGPSFHPFNSTDPNSEMQDRHINEESSTASPEVIWNPDITGIGLNESPRPSNLRPPQTSPAPVIPETAEAVLIWDTFLKELGV